MQKMKSLRKARSELDDERTDGRRTAGSQMAAVQVRIRQRQRTDGIRVSDELDLSVVMGRDGTTAEDTFYAKIKPHSLSLRI